MLGRTVHPGRAILVLATAAWGCSESPSPAGVGEVQDQLVCSINSSDVRSGGVSRDGIPALTDPPFVGANERERLTYLAPDDRVIGLVVDGQPLAVPHNVLWWHEIANLSVGGRDIAVSFCPLTGSSLAFSLEPTDGDPLGVSGLLFRNNLIMFNRTGGPSIDDSLWPQMLAQARCGPQDGTRLPQVPVVETTWAGWKDLHPDTRVLPGDLGFARDYSLYPYGNYESLTVPFLFSMALEDDRRLPKERVIGVPDYLGGGLAFPTLALAQLGAYAAVEETFGGQPLILLWDTDKFGGMAYSPVVNGEALNFVATEDGIFDEDTGSRWTIMGEAVSGPLAGTQLDAFEETYMAFWGAWVNFHQDTRLWTGE